MQNIRNIGIFAHVDAGKTTLTEQILLHTGAIRTAGRVDSGNTTTDSLTVEKQRGISVRSGTVCVQHQDTLIRIIDTPGHVDFSHEVETALLAVDGAVLVVSAVEGVQAQTAVIYRVLTNLGLPLIVFINKIDRAGADIAKVMGELAALIPYPILMEQGAASLVDQLTVLDDPLLALAVESDSPLTTAAIVGAAARICRSRQGVPVYSGAALKGVGVRELLDAVVNCLPPPEDAGELSIAAYHVRRVGEERQVSLRVFGGELTLGAVEEFGRVRRLRIRTPTGEQNVAVLQRGDIGVAVGLEGLRAGMWLGTRVKGKVDMATPVLRAQVVPQKEGELPALIAALEKMHDETANLYPTFEPRSRRLHIRTMGEIHQQILEQTLLDDHHIAATLMPPEVLYRETPLGVGYGAVDMWGAPWRARASFRVEPGARGSGVVFVSETHVDELPLKYQLDIEKNVYSSLQEGLSGWPTTDIVVTLTAGQGSWLSWGGESSRFGPVVPLGLFAALQEAGIIFLEPVYSFIAQVEEGAAGALLYELSLARATCEPTLYERGTATLRGLVPVGTSQRFAAKVMELSRGYGLWRTEPAGYYPAPPGVGAAIPRTTPDPTNRQLFIDFITGRSQRVERSP
ncbi:MAG: TetM/TetW/TetO/TetS family tetracycline resistance ribosomal protection protein [Symbiobacteriaceae bacterium]|nr:TetM/TetW/TetO/TetS family tetracycline resistance ribosomal protection protein [Symbiobacteriaceae bacterium]